MSSPVEQIKDRLDIADVVGSYIKLERAGKRLKARCPFHTEKTPSFFVSPDRGAYYCFGCSKGGDIFSFVEEFEGLDFPGALRVLAERAGVELKPMRAEVRGERERIFECLEEATRFFEKRLEGANDVKKYVAERGVTEETSNTFRLGYAPDSWRDLYDHLKAKGFSDTELLAAGLSKQAETGRLYDTFRSRLMFPIADSAGRVIAFSGRIFGTDDGAKYLNTPETELFVKSRTLYAFDRAKVPIRKHDFAVIVEGNFDVILSHQAGFPTTVAPLGTALTEEHLTRIGRLTKNIVLALDADSAGIASAERSAGLALSLGFDVKVARLEKGKDPADTIREHKDLWRNAIKGAVHVVEFLLETLCADARDPRAAKRAISERVLPYVVRITNKLDQDHFVKLISDRAGVSRDALYAEMSRLAALRGASDERSGETPERRDDEPLSDETRVARRLIGFLLWQKSVSEPAINIASAETALLERAGLRLAEPSPAEDSGEVRAASVTQAGISYDGGVRASEAELIFEAESIFEGSERLAEEFEELLARAETLRLALRLGTILTALKQAEIAGDETHAHTLLEEFQEVSHELEEAKQKIRGVEF